MFYKCKNPYFSYPIDAFYKHTTNAHGMNEKHVFSKNMFYVQVKNVHKTTFLVAFDLNACTM